MREAAVWWHAAMQLASDEQDQAQAAIQAWDPAVPFDARETRRQCLAIDDRGYVQRALGALQNAARLASTPAEREQALCCLRLWKEAAGRHTEDVS